MNLLDNHAAYRKFREDFGIYRDRPGSVKGYLLERKLQKLLREIAPPKSLFELAESLGLGYLTLKEIIEDAPLKLEAEQLREALALYEAEADNEAARKTLILHLKQTLEA